MSTSDGIILSVTKIVDHGPAPDCWNLVILSEGYRASELATKFYNDVTNFVNLLQSTVPFNDLWCGINVYRVDVASNQSGADDPGACDGSGAVAATYFDAKFCGDNQIRRLLTVNATTAQAVANAQVAQLEQIVVIVNQIVVIVNSSTYGGSGGAVAVCSTHLDAYEIAIHEMGHSAFGLADEYSSYYGCGTQEDADDINRHNYPINGAEPVALNSTKDTNRATNKWRDLILPTTPVPTMSNPDCTTCDTRPSPVSAGTVGTFEGSSFYHCGLHRPEFDCKMRNLGVGFCAVCQRRIRQTLAPYTMSVVLRTPSLAFTNIPEGLGGVGVTTYRAIVFEVTSCTPAAYGIPITLRIKSGPTAGFGVSLGLSVSVSLSASAPVGIGRLWITYTSQAAGSSSTGSVTVEAVETQQIWTVSLSANTVPRKKTAVVMVLDHSGSMSEPAGNGRTKVDNLREAASNFVDLMLQGDGLGLVRFDHTAQRIMNVTDVGPLTGTTGGRSTAESILAGPQLNPAGATSIGDGVLKGKQALDDAQAAAMPPFDVTAMVVLTDGNENTPPMLSTASSSITANTFAIGFGTADNVSAAALNALTQNRNGYLLVTGNLTPDQSNRLSKYFLQILAGITSATVVLDPQSHLISGIRHRIPFPVTGADYGIDVILLGPDPRYLNFYLETPDGQIIDPARAATEASVEFVATERMSFYRLSLPALPGSSSGSHRGTWHAVLALAQGDPKVGYGIDRPGTFGGRALPYDLIVHAYSSLMFKITVQQKSLEPGAEVVVRAQLTEYDVPVEQRAHVWAEITHPDGTGTHLTFKEVEAGQFEARFTAGRPGVYQVRGYAVGNGFDGMSFQREGTLTAATFVGGDRSPDLFNIMNSLEILYRRFWKLLIWLLVITLIVGILVAILVTTKALGS